jgi:hypothetical protein
MLKVNTYVLFIEKTQTQYKQIRFCTQMFVLCSDEFTTFWIPRLLFYPLRQIGRLYTHNFCLIDFNYLSRNFQRKLAFCLWRKNKLQTFCRRIAVPKCETIRSRFVAFYDIHKEIKSYVFFYSVSTLGIHRSTIELNNKRSKFHNNLFKNEV